MQFLSTLQLKTIVSLNPARPPRTTRIFAQENNIELVHLGLQPWRNASDWSIFAKELAQDALTYIVDKRNYPLLLIDATGGFIGILRHIQNWAFTSILMEYRDFAGDYKTSYKTEVFLELQNFRVISHEEAVRRRKSIEQGLRPTILERSKGNSKQVILHLPPDDVLPDWWKRQRTMAIAS